MPDFYSDETNLVGVKILEASAGTGKTYSLERIVSRLIVGDYRDDEHKHRPMEIGQILLVTFTKAATAELRLRVRKTLCDFRDLCAKSLEGETLKKGENTKLLEAWIREGISEKVALERLENAINNYDDAVISTIHGFCQNVLKRYAFSLGGDFGLTLATDYEMEKIEEQVRAECLERLPMDADSKRLREIFLAKDFNWSQVFEALSHESREVRENVQILDSQHSFGIDGTVCPGAFEWFKDNVALWAIDRLKEIKRARRLTTYDDMLLDLRDALRGDRGEELAKVLRRQYKGVLIDEFQDTDPVQYEIFSKIFLKGQDEDEDDRSRCVIFVGDPKQAIYSFRSAEIETYQNAVKEIGGINEENIYRLKRNFRSTPTIVKAVNAFFNHGSESGERDSFLMPNVQGSRLWFDSDAQESNLPLFFKERETTVYEPEPSFEFWSNAVLSKPMEDETADLIPAQSNGIEDELCAIVNDVARLLSGKKRGTKGTFRDGSYGYFRKNSKGRGEFHLLEASDVAVLVRSKSKGEKVVAALAEKKIPAFIPTDIELFTTPEASDFSLLLNALADPEDRSVLGLAMATRFVGADLDAVRSDEARGLVRQFFSEAEKRLRMDGIYVAFSYLMHASVEVDGRCLFETERRLFEEESGAEYLAKLLELIEIAQEAWPRGTSASSVQRWLSEQKKRNDKVESKAISEKSMVRVVTIHKSKGLQYPVVYFYGASNMAVSNLPYSHRQVFREIDGNSRILKVDCRPRPVAWHQDKNKNAPTVIREEQEQVRLAYVAMTRAAKRLVVPALFAKERDSNAYNPSVFAGVLIESLLEIGQKTGGVDGNRCVTPSVVIGSVIDNAIDAWRIRLEKSLAREKTAILVNAERFIKENGMKGSFRGTSDSFSFRGFEQLDGLFPALTSCAEERLACDSAHRLSSAWTQVSFSSMEKALTGRHTYPGKSNFFGFPAGPDAGTFLHETIEALVRDGVKKTERIDDLWLDDFVTRRFDYSLIRKNIKSSDDVSYDKALLEALGLDGSVQTEEYARTWLKKVMNRVITEAFGSGVCEPLLDLIHEKQVVTEADFLEFAFGSNRAKLTVAKIASELSNLGISNLRFTPKEAEQGAYGDLRQADRSIAGFLTGQIDLIFKTKNADGIDQYWILDWKSNKIEIDGHSRDYWGNYTRENMEQVMNDSNYKLQALVYLVALRRYLISRYGTAAEADKHIGGALYVFLRGMLSDGRHGVYSMPYGEYARAIDQLDTILGKGEF